jgi:capping protein beta
MRRLPPQQIEKNLSDLIDLVGIPFLALLFNSWPTFIENCCYQVPDLCEDLLSSVDQPLKIARDEEAGKDYLLCDYNRDGDSYRYNAEVFSIPYLHPYFQVTVVEQVRPPT